MDKLPVFAGRTQVRIIKPQEAPETTTLTTVNGNTQSWRTPGQPGRYRAVYTSISEEQLNQVREFFESNKSSERWQCSSPEGTLDNCFFTKGQPFPGAIQHATEGYILELVFQALYQK
jgi:hypothetical protein